MCTYIQLWRLPSVTPNRMGYGVDRFIVAFDNTVILTAQRSESKLWQNRLNRAEPRIQQILPSGPHSLISLS